MIKGKRMILEQDGQDEQTSCGWFFWRSSHLRVPAYGQELLTAKCAKKCKGREENQLQHTSITALYHVLGWEFLENIEGKRSFDFVAASLSRSRYYSQDERVSGVNQN
jgi:hypothetical protein